MNFSKYNYINKSLNSLDNMNNSSISQKADNVSNYKNSI